MKRRRAEPRWGDALVQFQGIVGTAHVLTSAADLDRASTATFATTARVRGIVRPATRAEVQACVRAATAFGVPVYPVSRGCNWGYGSRVPPRDAILLDLQRMDRIVGFDRELAYVTVEPGVTVRQLYAHLDAQRPPLLRLSVTGSSPEASLVGNALERGLGNGGDFDRFANACELEVVLPTGEVVHTGLAGFDGARAAHTVPYAPGPSLGGLFAQSSLGVVTRMTIWLWPEPGYREVIRVGVSGARRAASLFDRARELLLERALGSSVVVANDLRSIARARRYPWERTLRTPLPASARAALRREADVSAWTASFTVEGSDRASVGAERRAILAATRGLAARVSIARGVGRNPIDAGNLSVAYWRKRTPPPAAPDPDRDRCGVIWHNALVPLRGREVVRAAALAEAICARHGFDPLLSAALGWPRAACVTALLAFDRDVQGEDTRALACAEELGSRFAGEGWLPHRVATHGMPIAFARSDDMQSVMGRIKAALDPAGVLAPGRYEHA